jgi:hypothetical protein
MFRRPNFGAVAPKAPAPTPKPEIDPEVKTSGAMAAVLLGSLAIGGAALAIGKAFGKKTPGGLGRAPKSGCNCGR